jgi:hypothetical protein
MILGTGRFLESDPCAFAEHVTDVVTHGDYVFACEDLRAFHQIALSLDESRVDIMKNTNFAST